MAKMTEFTPIGTVKCYDTLWTLYHEYTHTYMYTIWFTIRMFKQLLLLLLLPPPPITGTLHTWL